MTDKRTHAAKVAEPAAGAALTETFDAILARRAAWVESTDAELYPAPDAPEPLAEDDDE